MTLAIRPKPPVHHKKRNGGHQRQNKHFAKTYWPYLPMVSIVALGIVFSAVWSQKAAVLGAKSDVSGSSLLSSSNDARSADHEAALTLNPTLNSAAQAKADDMVTRNYWSHSTPDGAAPWSFITGNGYNYEKAGENLAYGFSSADSVITAWLNSPAHRVNALGADYSQVGFGIASSPNFHGNGPETVIVALYASPAPAGTAGAVPTAANTPDALKTASLNSEPVSHLQLMTGGEAPWLAVTLTMTAAVGLLYIMIQHGRAWHRLLVRSEAFVLHHPLLDIAAVGLVTTIYILSQAAGFIA